jgi:hypothetical protein
MLSVILRGKFLLHIVAVIEFEGIPNQGVLKLGVATLLRVAKCPKRVAKFGKKEIFA